VFLSPHLTLRKITYPSSIVVSGFPVAGIAAAAIRRLCAEARRQRVASVAGRAPLDREGKTDGLLIPPATGADNSG